MGTNSAKSRISTFSTFFKSIDYVIRVVYIYPDEITRITFAEAVLFVSLTFLKSPPRRFQLQSGDRCAGKTFFFSKVETYRAVVKSAVFERLITYPRHVEIEGATPFPKTPGSLYPPRPPSLRCPN